MQSRWTRDSLEDRRGTVHPDQDIRDITRSLKLHVYGLWEEARAHIGRPVRNQASQAQETQRRFYV